MKKKLLAILMATVFACSVLAGCGAKSDVYTIGICQIVQHVALDAATQGFKDALTEKLGDKVVFDEQNAQGEPVNCATIITSFASKGVNLILANATPPLQAAAAGTKTIPILGTSVTDYASALDIDNWTGTTGRNISGTSDLAPLSEQAAMLNELFPESKNIGILFCSAEANSQYQADVVKGELEKLGKTVTFYSFVDTNDVQAVTQKAADSSDVIYVPTDNTAASNTGIIDPICKKAGVPIIAGEEGICSGCGVATLSISYYDLGYKTGEMAYEILVNGKDIKSYEIQYAPNVTKKYDAARCAELGVEVPAGYVAIGE